MGAAGLWNILIDLGASFVRDLTWTNDAGSNPDLSSGYTASIVFADSWDTAAVYTGTHADVITLGASGAVGINIPGATIDANFSPGEYVFHLDVVHTASARIDRLVYGTAKVRPKAGS